MNPSAASISLSSRVQRPCSAAALARYAGQPLLLAAVVGAIALSISRGAPLAPASLAILFASLVYLFAMERWIPYREAWRPAAHEWKRDGIYFGINGIVSTLVSGGAALVAIHFARDTSGLPLAGEIAVGFPLAALVGYWTHRLGHDVPFLWALHGVHHAPTKVNAWNNNVIHFLDLAFQNGSSLLLLLALGLSPQAVFAITAFRQVVGFVDHCNADFRFGPLNYLIGSPEQHRLHHSTDLAEAGNYSILPLWDIAFGTFTWRPGRRPSAVGIQDPGSFPEPDSVGSIVANAVHPLKVWSGRR